MITHDIYLFPRDPRDPNIHKFSANGVPWPHDEWLKLTGQMTVAEAVEVIKRWGNSNDRNNKNM